MKKCIVLMSVLSMIAFLSSATAQQLPSHGAAAAGKTPTLVIPENPTAPYSAWRSDVGLEIIYMPSPDDDRFDDMLGFNGSITFPLTPYIGFRTVAGYESFQGDDGFDDADVVPLGFSFMFSPLTEGFINAGLELGLRYNVVDYSEAGDDFDNSFSGIAGLHVATDPSGGFGVEFGAGYRFDIVESENDAGDELSLDGLALKLALRFSF